jgi:hypothetical protein
VRARPQAQGDAAERGARRPGPDPGTAPAGCALQAAPRSNAPVLKAIVWFVAIAASIIGQLVIFGILDLIF